MKKFLTSISVFILLVVLSLSASAIDGGNSFESATPINTNTQYEDYVENITDMDCYSFTLDKPGNIKLSFLHEFFFSSEKYWHIWINDQYGNSVTAFFVAGNEANYISPSLGLEKGTYIVTIASGDYYSYVINYFCDYDYTFSVNFTPSAYWEKEKNDNFQNSTPITFDNKYFGSVLNDYEFDFFRFSVTDKTNINIEFTNKPISDPQEYYDIQIVDDDLYIVARMSIKGSSSITKLSKTLEKGTYYIVVSGGDYQEVSQCFKTDDYSIKIHKHKEISLNAVAPTCTKTGLTAGKKCSVCGTITVAQKTVAKVPHNYKTTTTKATLTKDGAIVTACLLCKAVNKTTKIPYPKTFTLSGTSYTYTGKAINPTVTVKGSDGKVISKSYYTVKYSNNVNPGTATVTVTFKGNYSGTKTLKFYVLTKLKTSKATSTAIALTWTKVPGAKYYKVERSTDGKKWTVLTTSATSNSYTAKSLKAGTKYQFRVTALDSSKKTIGKTSAVLKTGTLTSAPSVTLKSTKSKTATATWKKVTGATNYVVYKSTDAKKWTKVGTTKSTAYNLTKLTGGKKIYVKVYAYNAYSKLSAASAVKSITVKK